MNATMLNRIPSEIRVVFFDAVGTLIDPHPSAGSVYAEVGRRFGTRLEAEEIKRRFYRVFQEEEDFDATQNYCTDEARERQRWHRIVRSVLDDIETIDPCFHALYQHFSNPEAWRCKPEALRVLTTLAERGYQLGLASNFDHRLRQVIAGLPELELINHVVISSEVGWKKPGKGFFDRMCEIVGMPPAEILMIGDDLENDHFGALKAGFHSLLFDPEQRSHLPEDQRLDNLEKLVNG